MTEIYEKQEKILWYIQILLFAVSLYIYFQMGNNEMIQVILAVLSMISLTADRFYFSAKIGQDVYFSYAVAYGVIILFGLILTMDFAGVFHFQVLDTSGRLLWALTPALALLWKTKFIAFREWDQNQ